MPPPTALQKVVGHWKGESVLHTPWIDHAPRQTSISNLTVQTRGVDSYAVVEYDWKFEGASHAGTIMVCASPVAVSAAWVDSWHQSTSPMQLTGLLTSDNHVSVSGAYQVPDHPDWFWRIEFLVETDDLILTMTNISPEGAESLAVSAKYERA